MRKDETWLGALQILNTITTKKANKLTVLMFAEVEVAGRTGSDLTDMGAYNLFISEEGAKRLGLRAEKTRGRLKTVNSERILT